jgi:hypothetical protein
MYSIICGFFLVLIDAREESKVLADRGVEVFLKDFFVQRLIRWRRCFKPGALEKLQEIRTREGEDGAGDHRSVVTPDVLCQAAGRR